MSVDRRALAYSDQFAPVLVSRCINAAKANRPDLIPQPIRSSVVAYVQGGRMTVDVNQWAKDTLYAHRVRTGGDYPLPPEVQTPGQTAAKVGVVAAKAGFGFAKTLLKLSKF
ncbi:hypothetical protein [Rhizobium metallidurans]|uniref:Uncharacterized protein n=1 Tax=Rhizobium metallidurans TaxID=1265931 RepID=A0A7W6CVH1_9HYPH|nr:hypothetical protein [Rhizobium metallidurans]MBB3967171.1 hypothetical protein [Rhizobium metallidurans]